MTERCLDIALFARDRRRFASLRALALVLALLDTGCEGEPRRSPACGGAVGCDCGEEQPCAAELVCDGTVHHCRQALTCDDLACVAHQICAGPRSGRDAQCEKHCEAGYAWDADVGRCRLTCDAAEYADLRRRCTSQHRVCESDESGQAWCGSCVDDYGLVAGTCVKLSTCKELACEEESRVCDPISEGNARCGECKPGYSEDPTTGACENPDLDALCSELGCPADASCEQDEDGSVTCRCFDEQLQYDGVGCVPDCGDGPAAKLFEPTGSYLCQVEEGYFCSPTNSEVIPCDSDGDGWVRQSARAALEAGHADAHFNRCHLRIVDEFILSDEQGRSASVKADQPLPMYESDRNDDPVLLRAELCGDESDCAVPGASSLNRLTKLCASKDGDFNDNEAADVDEWGGMPATPEESSWNRLSYFVELYNGWFVPGSEPSEEGVQHGSYVIQERSRAELEKAEPDADDAADHVALLGSERSDYWRTCRVLPDATRSQYAEPVGMDFGDIRPADPPEGWLGLNHHSQFKCLVVAEQASPEHPELVGPDGKGALAAYTRNACDFVEEREPAPGPDETNPSRPVFECTSDPPPLTTGTVFWATVGYHYYPADEQHAGYLRGCVNACGEARAEHARAKDEVDTQAVASFLASLKEPWGCTYGSQYKGLIACHADEDGALVCDEACDDGEDNDLNGRQDDDDYYVWPVPSDPHDWPSPYDPNGENPGRLQLHGDCPTGIGQGECSVGRLGCRGGLPFCQQRGTDEFEQIPEVCNGVDDNCNENPDWNDEDLILPAENEGCPVSKTSESTTSESTTVGRVCVEWCEDYGDFTNTGPNRATVDGGPQYEGKHGCRYECTDPVDKPLGECAKYGEWQCGDTYLKRVGLQCVSTFERQDNDTTCDGLDSDCDGRPDTEEEYWGYLCHEDKHNLTADDHIVQVPPERQDQGVCAQYKATRECVEYTTDAGTTEFGDFCLLDENAGFTMNDTECDGKDSDCDGIPDTQEGSVIDLLANASPCPTPGYYQSEEGGDIKPLHSEQQQYGVCAGHGATWQCLEHETDDGIEIKKTCVLMIVDEPFVASEEDAPNSTPSDNVLPPSPLCDGKDNDCDDYVDEDMNQQEGGLCNGEIHWDPLRCEVPDLANLQNPVTLRVITTLTVDGGSLEGTTTLSWYPFGANEPVDSGSCQVFLTHALASSEWHLDPPVESAFSVSLARCPQSAGAGCPDGVDYCYDSLRLFNSCRLDWYPVEETVISSDPGAGGSAGAGAGAGECSGDPCSVDCETLEDTCWTGSGGSCVYWRCGAETTPAAYPVSLLPVDPVSLLPLEDAPGSVVCRMDGKKEVVCEAVSPFKVSLPN